MWHYKAQGRLLAAPLQFYAEGRGERLSTHPAGVLEHIHIRLQRGDKRDEASGAVNIYVRPHQACLLNR